MSKFSSKENHDEVLVTPGKPKKTFSAPCIEEGSIEKVVLKENLGANNSSLIEIYFVSSTTTEGLDSPEFSNRQYCKNTFWLTENAMKEYKNKEEGKPNYASIIRFLAILADNLGVREMWDQASSKVNTNEEYAQAITNFFKGRTFCGLIRGTEKSFVNNEGDTVKMIEPSLNIFGVFSRACHKKEDLEKALQSANDYMEKGNPNPLITPDKDAPPADTNADSSNDEW